MTSVSVNTYTHSVTYVADNILKSLKDIILHSGLDPTNFVDKDSWASKHRAITAWMQGQWLTSIELEIYNPKTDALITKWTIEVQYGWTGDGGFWTDTDQLKYAIRKAGLAPSEAKYSLLLYHKTGAPSVDGWGSTTARSTVGFVPQSLGATVQHNGLAANTSYWRKAG